jgi:two-component system, chemotaxis family, CheB/CheR fusion protein
MERDQTSPGGDDPSSDETEKVGREPKTREARPTVVGIGGSAGALKALVTFFESIPQETGMAFVVVVHLAPEHQSLLPEVLGRAAALPVIQVTRRIPLAPDHIYVIPPGKNLVVTNSHLSVAEFQGPTGRQTTIDYFFRSLASNHPDTIGIILSGGGSDGTVGMKAIKELGGLLLVQEPEEAEFASMPRSAIGTGLVDFVLPARQLAEMTLELHRMGHRVRRYCQVEEVPENEEAILEGESRTVRLFVQPADREEQATQVLVMFLETASPPGPIPTGEEDPRLHHVERELVQTKERLQMAIEDFESRQEEYRAANEELQSTNEEYKSTLEELETSKEELQSINEELHTVNQELQYNLNEVTGASNDIKNLVEASDLAILFLDRELRITRHTPSLSRLFNVIPADCGRPIGHVTHRLNYPQLQIDAEEVLETEQSIERELLDTDRNWYLVRIIPYRTIRERVEGIVFTFVDITRVKQAEEQLRRSQESHRLLVAGVKEYAIFMLDAEGRISTWNEGAERIFGYDQEEVIGRPGGILLSEKERAVFEEELEQAQNQGESVCERWYLRRDGKPFWGTGVITLLLDSDENRAGFVQVLRDNTLRREAAEALEKSQRELRAFNETLEQRIAERTAEVEGKSRQVHQLASELVLAEQRERHRIAQMLHDHIQQLLYSTKMRLAMLRDEQWPDQLSDMRRMAEEAYEHLTVAIQETRQLTVNLSPPVLRDEGLVQALEWLIHQMSDSHGLRVKLKAKADIVIEAEEMRILVFHIVRELLFNIVKHAEVEAATVELYEDSGLLRVDVSDKGTGFSVEEVFGQRGRHGGLGLLNARERLSLFGGSIQVESQSGAGTKISLSLPIK